LNPLPVPENACRRFLLGIASEEEQTRVEDAVLAGELDASFLLDAEDGLIDDYLLSSMTHEEQHGFTTHFLSSGDRRQRLAFTAALIEYAGKQPAEKLPIGPKFASHNPIRVLLSSRQTAFLAVAASVILAALAGFQQMELRRQGQIASETSNELTRLRAALGSRNAAAAVGNPQIGEAYTLGVEQMPGIEFESSTRDVHPSLLRIPAHALFVRIGVKLSLPLAMKYREVLVASNGDRLWTQEFPASTVPATNETTIALPRFLLPPGNYHLLLESASANDHFEESADWVFRVPLNDVSKPNDAVMASPGQLP
jgi:hypothetical protein